VDSKCSERDRLIEQYVAAVNAYGKAVTEKRPARDRRTQRHLTQKTLESCQNALNAVLNHEEAHGCGNAAARKVSR
jgi:ribosomal protein L32